MTTPITDGGWNAPAYLPTPIDQGELLTPLIAEEVAALWLDEETRDKLEEEYDTGSLAGDIEAFASDAEVWVFMPAGEFDWWGLSQNIEER